MIEVVVAITVIGLALTFVLPRLTGWIDRLELSSAQQKLEDALAGLGAKARRDGRTIFLRSSRPGAANAADEAQVELSRGWAYEADPPIAFRYDGLCTGGTVRLITPSGEKAYRLAAPYCRPQPL